MVFGLGTRDARPSTIPSKDLERALSIFCKAPAPDTKSGAKTRISTDSFHHITGLLRHLEFQEGLKGWSRRPRTYTVLRNINRLDAMQTFIDLELKDISLPYSKDTLSGILQDSEAQKDFLRFQECVLTRASDLEKAPEGDHVHFAKDEGDKHFHVVRHLGSGGFGSVDHVWSKLSFKHYARKQFRRGRNVADKQVLLRFEEELSALKRLSHHHLVRVVGSYTDQKSVAFLMDPVADYNLMTYLLQPTSYFYNLLPSLRTYFGCLASAVAYLHSQKIRHRDLKPENILLSKGKLYVADFGAALDWSRRERSTTFSDSVPHTARYMAPEVAKNAPKSSASDMWSLGIVFLEMTTVLRGKTIKQMRRFMEKNGSGHPFVWGNMGAAHQWFEVLRQNKAEQDSDNEPLSWIKNLIQRDPLSRPRAKALVRQIMESTAPGSFCGICCMEDDDRTESSLSSPSSSLSDGSYGTARQELDPFELIWQSTEVFVKAPRQNSGSVERWLETTHHLVTDLLPSTSSEPFDGLSGPHDDDSGEENLASTSVVLPHRRSDEIEGLTELSFEDGSPGYDVIEDDSDNEEVKQEDQGYDVVEDSSDSGTTVRPIYHEPKFPGEADSEQQNLSGQTNQISWEGDSEQRGLEVQSNQTSGVEDSEQRRVVAQSNQTPREEDSKQRGLVIQSNQTPREEDSKRRGLVVQRNQTSGVEDSEQRCAVAQSNRTSGEEDSEQRGLVIQSNQTSRVEDSEQRGLVIQSNQTPREEDSKRRGLVVQRNQSPKVRFDTAGITSDPTLNQLEWTPGTNVDDSAGTSLDDMLQLTGLLTASNLAKHTETSNMPDAASMPKPDCVSRSKPEFSAKFYMEEVWEAASSVPTSALSENTRQKLDVSAFLLRYQDKSMKYLEQFTQNGNACATMTLLRAGCNPGTEENPRHQPLINAVKGGSPRHTKCARYLLEYGANVNVRHRRTGKTALHLAIEHRDFHGHSNLIRLLLEAGANPNVKDRNGDYPLLKILYGDYEPLEKYKRDALALLLQSRNSTNVNIMPPANGWNVSAGHEKEQREVLQQLLYYGANVEERGGDPENTALHQAVLNGREDAVRLILEYGGDPRIKNKEKKTACHLGVANFTKCSVKMHSSIMSQLFQAMDLEIPKEKDQCAIVTAVVNNDLPSAKILLDYGANANHRSKKMNHCPERPILHHAITNGNQEMVKLLTKRGASVGAKDELGVNGVDCARDTGHTVIVEYLAGKMKDGE